jgi:hypothetical protein
VPTFSRTTMVYGANKLRKDPHLSNKVNLSCIFVTFTGLIHWLGGRVKMSAAKLKSQCLVSSADTSLVVCHFDGVLVGHVFATTWTYDGGNGVDKC